MTEIRSGFNARTRTILVIRSLLAVSVGGLGAPHFGYAASTPQALEVCRRLADNSARLACFDAALPPLPAPNTAQPRPPADPARPSVPEAAAVPLAAAAPGATPAPAAPTPAVLTAAPAKVAPDFGLPQRPLFERSDALESAVAGAFDGWGPNEQIKLTNGQIWQISDGSSAGYSLQSPKVRITRGTFGTFFMQVEGVSQTPKVRRVR